MVLWKKIWQLTRPLACAYLLVVLAMTFIENWLVYPAPPKHLGDWNPQGYGHQDVWFASADGTRLHGWLFEHPEPQHVVLYCHGNGEHVAYNADLMDHLRRELDATVLIFDYRGYGQSEGRPHEAGIVADGKAAHRWLADRTGIATDQVVLVGRSLGGGVAVASAAELSAKALVLQSTFARMVDTAAELYPWLPIRLVMRNRYDSLALIKEFDGPVLQSHGTADKLIPYHQAQQLFDAVRSDSKKWFDVPGGSHCTPQPRGYYAQLREFLQLPSNQSGPRPAHYSPPLSLHAAGGTTPGPAVGWCADDSLGPASNNSP